MPLLSVNGTLLGHFLPINCFYTEINLRMNKDVWATDSKVVIHETWKESDILASIWKEGFPSYVPIPWWFKVSFNLAIYSWWYIIWIKLYIHDKYRCWDPDYNRYHIWCLVHLKQMQHCKGGGVLLYIFKTVVPRVGTKVDIINTKMNKLEYLNLKSITDIQ